MRALVVTLFLSLVALSHAGMLSNGTFDQGNWEIRESPQGDWLSLRADGSAAPKGTSETGNYGQSAVGTLNTPGLTSIAAHLQARGGNAIRQTFQQVDAGTFTEFQVSFRMGYRRDVATRGDLTLRVSLLDPSDGSLFTFQDLTLPDPGVGANSLTLENLTLSVDRQAYGGRPIAIQFANITPHVPIGDAWMGTLIIDDVMVNPTTPRVAASAEMSAAVHGVIERLLPGRQGEFSFAIIPPAEGRDVFEIESGAEGAVVIRGNRTLSLVSGFHWYLKHTAKCHVSWNGNQLAFASPAPAPQGLIRQVSPYKHRNQGNVTVGSYTQAYWDWERWEKEIDFMALNGITQAVVIPGHQKIWQNTLRRLNFSEADLAAYIPNLGHAAWWLFGNLEGDGGPLPQEVIDGEAVLGQQIVSRMRELGIEPILFGYVGFVPTTFPNYFPNAHVLPQGLWMNYRRPDVLSPLDPQFASVAAIWYEELAALYGEAKFLTGDLFHEGGNSSGLNLTQAAAAVHASMLNALPDSTWLIQAWGGNPDPSLIAGTDFHHTLVQQLISDMTTGMNDAGTLRTFQGRPWTWNEISNFGGNNGLYGDLRLLASLPELLLNHSDRGRFAGLGVFMEAIELNPIYFDLLSDMVWRTSSPDLESWLNELLVRRYGAASPDAEAAWAMLRDSVYRVSVFQYGVTDFVIGARPGPNVFRARLWGDNNQYWNPWAVALAAEKILSAGSQFGAEDTYRFDLIDILRQTLNDYTFAVYQKMMTAYRAGDSGQFEAEAARLLSTFDHLDALLATHSQWTVGAWTEAARNKSSDPATKDLMESNARQLITTWTKVDNPGLNDYASRSRSGLVGDYYKQRWSIYVEDLRKALAGTGNGNYSGAGFEHLWRDDRSVSYLAQPVGDTVTVANQLWADLGADILAEAEAAGRWQWQLTGSGESQLLTWDVSTEIRQATRMAVVFDYQSGRHALEIQELALLRNGEVIASDNHLGRTGIIDTNHAYSLSFESAHHPGDTYSLRATVAGDGGGNSKGVIHVSTPGHATDASFVGRFRRNSVVIGDHETIDFNADHSVVHYQNGQPTRTYQDCAWAQVDGLMMIKDQQGKILSYHTLTHPDSLTTDRGVMTRRSVVESTTEWAQSHGLIAPHDAPNADPDHDGLSNLLEYALGMDPSVANPQATHHTFSEDRAHFHFQFDRPANYQTIGFTYTLEQSPSLEAASWSPAPIAESVTSAHPTRLDLERATLKVSITEPVAFFRLKIGGAPEGFSGTTPEPPTQIRVPAR